MTQEIIARRLPASGRGGSRHSAGPLPRRSRHARPRVGVPFERGPEEIADLPVYLGRGGAAPDLSRFDMRIFAEIVDASTMSVSDVVARAKKLAKAGADVIEPRLSARHALRAYGGDHRRAAWRRAEGQRRFRRCRGAYARRPRWRRSSAQSRRAQPRYFCPRAPRSFPFSSPRRTAISPRWQRAAAKARARKIDFILDPILDPIHFGFADSLAAMSSFAGLSRAPKS